jgi:hypothetical protein
VFNSVVVAGRDPLASKRRVAISQIIPDARSSAARIVDYLRVSLRATGS